MLIGGLADFNTAQAGTIMLIGTEVEGGCFVRCKDCQTAERHLKQLVERVRRVEGKRVVVADGNIVTAYHARAAKERSLLRPVRRSVVVNR